METDQYLAEITPEATISQIIAADKRAGELLASIGLSLSKHENETLRSVCQQRQWSEAEVLKWVKKHSASVNNKTTDKGNNQVPDKNSSLTEWVEFLEETFLYPNLALVEELEQNFPRIRKIHGNQYPWLKTMQWHFNKFKEVLRMYYEFERKKFFPLVRRLSNSNSNINHGTVQNLQKSFTIIQQDQQRLQRLMKTTRKKGNQFEHPVGACSTLRIQNENFLNLFSELNKQFGTESEQLIPQIKATIKTQR